MRHHTFVATCCLTVATGLILPATLGAQLISLKTVPVAAGDQFLLFPYAKMGMGGTVIAIDDTLHDPFVNPAAGSRLSGAQLFAAPTFYSISNEAGNGRSLPVGALFRSSGWFGGVSATLQQLEAGEEFFAVPWFEVPMRDDVAPLPPNALSRRSATNMYATIIGGTVLPGSVAIGASVSLADLDAVDGVEHLYAMSSDIRQSGHTEDFRLGLVKTFDRDQTLEAVVLHNRFDMQHDVAYVDWVLVDSTTWQWEQQTRVERNLDKTRTWGAHLEYRQPIGSRGWRAGGILTFNRKDHPKIPNYELVNIPRDPGHSTAFDIGVGIARTAGSTTFALDLVYEPASSETWAEAAADTVSMSGKVIREGEKTIENSFSFSNAVVSAGAAQRIGPVEVQAGVQVRAYDYHLDQWDNLAETSRRQNEDWMEWMPTWGLRVLLRDAEVRYMGRVTTGTGRPGVAWDPAVAERAMDAGLANDIVVAPSGPLTLQDATVLTHQVSVSIPIR
jgi:hypothetical protein